MIWCQVKEFQSISYKYIPKFLLRLQSSGMWCCALLYTSSNILAQPAAHTFYPEYGCSKLLTICHITSHHIQNVCSSNTHWYENLKCKLPAIVHLRQLKFVRHSLKCLLYYHHVYDFKHTKLFHIKSVDTCLISQYTTTDKQWLLLQNINEDLIQLFNKTLYYLQQFQNCTWNSINVPAKKFGYFLFWRLTYTINMKMQYISFMLTGWLFQNRQTYTHKSSLLSLKEKKNDKVILMLPFFYSFNCKVNNCILFAKFNNVHFETNVQYKLPW